MDIWNILEIDPTKDISIIKKAYAKKLKIYHPQEFPKEFQELREAYESAVKYTKEIKDPIPVNNDEEIYTDSNNSIFEFDDIKPSNNIKDWSNNVDDESLKSPVNEFMKSIEDLYNNFFLRIELEKWQALLSSDIIWNIDNKETISNRLFDFLSTHHYLPQDIWRLLDENFNWITDENILEEIDYDDFIKYMLKQLNQNNGLSYLNFKNIENVDYEKYLEYREKAFDALKELDLSEANSYICSAKEIYQGDNELLRLEGLYFLNILDSEKGVDVLSLFIAANPNHIDADHFNTIISYEKDKYKHLTNPNKLFIVAKSYFAIGVLEKSKEYMLYISKLNPSNIKVKNFLSQVHAKYRKKLTAQIKKYPRKRSLRLKNNRILIEICNPYSQYTLKKKNSNSKIDYRILLFIFWILAFIVREYLRYN